MTAAEQPLELALTIIEERAYAHVKHLIDTSKIDDAPDGPMADLVMDIQAEIFKEEKLGK